MITPTEANWLPSCTYAAGSSVDELTWASKVVFSASLEEPLADDLEPLSAVLVAAGSQ